MGNTKYSNVSIPTPMFLRLTKLVGHHGFGSTAEVVRWAIRQCNSQIEMLLDQIEREDLMHEIKDM